MCCQVSGHSWKTIASLRTAEAFWRSLICVRMRDSFSVESFRWEGSLQPSWILAIFVFFQPIKVSIVLHGGHFINYKDIRLKDIPLMLSFLCKLSFGTNDAISHLAVVVIKPLCVVKVKKLLIMEVEEKVTCEIQKNWNWEEHSSNALAMFARMRSIFLPHRGWKSL